MPAYSGWFLNARHSVLANTGDNKLAEYLKMYLDAGIEHVQEFMQPMLQQAASSILEAHKDRDAKSLLQELVQSKGYAPPVYNTVSDRGPDHKKTFEVVVIIDGREYGRGSGHSKQSAAKAAAQKALEAFGLS